MTSIGIVTGALVVLAFTGAGLFAWRSTSRSPLEPGPFWYWAWALLLLTGGLTEVQGFTRLTVFAVALVSPLFGGLLLAGGFRYRGTTVPQWLLPGAVGIGLLRAVSETLDHPELSGLLSLAVEPTAAALTGWWVHRTAAAQQASWPNRLMPICFLAIAALELFGAMRGLLDLGRLILWPLWLMAGIPLILLRLIAGMEHTQQAEGESLRDREGLAQATARLSELALSIREVLMEIGADGRVRWISESCREELDIAPHSLIGLSGEEMVKKLEVEFPTRPLPTTGDEKAVEQGRLAPIVFSVRDDHGRRRWLESHLARQKPGEGRTLVVTRDVTERIAAQEALTASEKRFRTFTQLSSDYCYLNTMDNGEVVETWATGRLPEISGYSYAELQDLTFTGYIHPDDLEPGRERFLRMVRNGGESTHEFRLLTKSGETRWITETLLVERDSAETRIFGAARDITNQRHTEQALTRAQKLDSLGLLAGGIAHDFNNLLTVMLGNAEMALDTGGDDSPAKEDLLGIVEAVEQAKVLTKQLLAYAGRGAVERLPIDLSERVRSVSELFGAALSSGVDLDLLLADELPSVIADPGEIQQLAMNLVLNAVEACEGGGRVQVSTRSMRPEDALRDNWIVGEVRAEASYVIFEVSDSGSGMTPKTLERVFDPFFSTKKAGRGLGLAAVIGIVRSVGAALHVESRPDKGTTFQVFFPASDREVTQDRNSGSRGPGAGRILVVDDEKRVLEIASRILERNGFEVRAAPDGPSAIEIFQRESFDVVLLDSVMPGMSGAETFDALRQIRPDAIVLMASGFAMEHAVGDLLERGLAGFIGKPFRAVDLTARIAELVEQGRDQVQDQAQTQALSEKPS